MRHNQRDVTKKVATRMSFVGVLALLIVGLGAVAASSASALEPWWHVGTGTTPSNLVSGSGADDVQTVTVNATSGTFNLNRKEEGFDEGEEEPGEPTSQQGERAHNEGVNVNVGASPAELRSKLETIYGAGNVVVTQAGAGAPYVVTFVGHHSDLYIRAIEEENVEVSGGRGEVVVAQQTEGHPDGEVYGEVENVGDAVAGGEGHAVTITAKLPAGLTATAATVDKAEGAENLCSVASPQEVRCVFTESVPAYDNLSVRIAVQIAAGASSGERVQLTVTGGGAAEASMSSPIAVSPAATPFAVHGYEMLTEDEGGSPDTQAGSHPFQLTTSLELSRVPAHLNAQQPEDQNGGLLPSVPPSLPRNLHFALPSGLLGNPTVVPQCSEAEFAEGQPGVFDGDQCPAETAIGVASVRIFDPRSLGYTTETVPLFNLVPAKGEPARFGFYILGVITVLDTAVRTGGGYNVLVNVENVPQSIAFAANTVTFWGTPGDPAHDASRGWSCLEPGEPFPESCEGAKAPPDTPFLVMPTSCPTQLQSSVQAQSWTGEEASAEESFRNPFGEPFPLVGCSQLNFEPTIAVRPDGEAASTPTGLNVAVHVPQNVTLNPAGRAEADVKSITVALPEGMQLSASAADGLQACSQAQVGAEGSVNSETGIEQFNGNPVSCPEASKLAKVKIKTPLLPNPLEGAVYLAAPQNFAGLPENPFSSLVAMYLATEDPVSGVLVKLAGSVTTNPASGQVTATFESPQLPFEDAEIEFFGTDRAPLATPAHCGTYTTTTSIAPWSNTAAVSPSSQFNISSGPNETGCPGSSLPFGPSLTGGTTNIQAGAFSALTTTISREDGQQNISQVQLKMPPGLSGILTGVPLCGEAQANAGTCSAASQIGSTIVSVGLGADPYSVTGGKVYLTGPYEGQPFGLSIVTTPQAGPFVLDEGHPVVVRASIAVNPSTAALTVTTNSEAEGYAIPHILDGIPLQIKHVNVTIERPGFTFNPTDCNPTAITGSVGSVEGASSPVSVPFQVTNCANLKFAPKFAVSTPGHTSKKIGAGLTATVTYPKVAAGTEADIKAVKVDLPKQLPSQLKTLQKACTDKQFEASPEGCPKHSVVGEAEVTTPLLPVPLTGKAYFVSHGGEAFPSLTMVLKGYGVTIDLVGSTFIHAGITSSTFKSVPDLPFNTFKLTLNQGEYAALAANLPEKDKGNLCGQKLAMPTAFVAQNGMEIHESTPISVSGCKKAKKTTKKKKKKSKKKQAGKGKK